MKEEPIIITVSKNLNQFSYNYFKPISVCEAP